MCSSPTTCQIDPIDTRRNRYKQNEVNGLNHFQWKHCPSSCLLIEKKGDRTTRCHLIELFDFLFHKSFTIYAESYVVDELPNVTYLQPFDNQKVDFVIALGGDGTLLHIAQLFPKCCPPVLAFSLGSLGFLTPFLIDDYEEALNDLIGGYVLVSSRTRLVCEIIRKDGSTNMFQAMNDVVCRPVNASLVCAIDSYIDDELFTTVYGDGLIISTSTGSTAYNLSADGAMVHPLVPTIVWTPICPHSLNAHPLVFPDNIVVSLRISPNARCNEYYVNADSQTTTIQKDDIVQIHISPFTIPTVCKENAVTDWLYSISDVLKWNTHIHTD